MLVRDVDLMRLSDTKVFALSLSLALLLAVVLVLRAQIPSRKSGPYLDIKVSPKVISPGEFVRVDVWCSLKEYDLTIVVKHMGQEQWSWNGQPKENHLWVSIYTKGWPEDAYLVEVSAKELGTFLPSVQPRSATQWDTFRIVSPLVKILFSPRVWGAVFLASAVAIYFLLVRRSPRSRR
jgi:hypothetical protein